MSHARTICFSICNPTRFVSLPLPVAVPLYPDGVSLVEPCFTLQKKAAALLVAHLSGGAGVILRIWTMQRSFWKYSVREGTDEGVPAKLVDLRLQSCYLAEFEKNR